MDSIKFERDPPRTSRRTFHPFPRLPTSLRVKILRMASAPTYGTHPFDIKPIIWLQTFRPKNFPHHRTAFFGHIGIGRYGPRRALMGTSRLARLVAFQEARRDVAAVDVRGLPGVWLGRDVWQERRDLLSMLFVEVQRLRGRLGALKN